MRVLSLIFTLILSGCIEKSGGKNPGFFENSLVSGHRVFNVNPNVVNTNNLKIAPGAWIPALRISAFTNRFETVDYCLLIKAPQDLDPGRIKFTKALLEEKCEDVLFKAPASEVKEFYNISVEYEGAELSLKIDKERFIYRFHNLGGPSVEVSLAGLAKGQRRDLLKDGEVCLKVEDDCSQGQDICERCEGGSYFVKNSACPEAYSKVCGEDKCGGKGEYACIRGHIASGVKDYCIQDSPVGFCFGKNRVGCVNKTLICE